MKTAFPSREPSPAGSALLLTLVMTTVALATLAGILAWSASTARLTYRSNQYACAVAAAEAATEKVMSQIGQDFRKGGEKLVSDNLNSYRQATLTAADSAYWAGWEFNDASGHIGLTLVQSDNSTNYVVLNSTYAGLEGFVHSFTIISNARQTTGPQNVVAGVLQQIQLATIPVFQFAMYSSGEMEISCGQPFTITGRVHSNQHLYVEPDNVMTFQSDVTAVGDILFQRDPLDTRSAPSGSVIYQGHKDSQVAAMNLPIGTNNSPAAVREIIQPAPPSEDPNSPMGQLRYHNLADVVVTITNSGTNTVVSATSGRFNNFATTVPNSEVNSFTVVTNSFWDAREGKTVQPIDLDIGALAAWSATNSNVRSALGSKDVSSLYVWDRRTLGGASLGAVRLTRGKQLPSLGLTVATARPLYILGHYNQTNAANLGTTNTSTTSPASLAADAITVLSPNWSDAKSAAALASRTAAPTTVNAAILAGAVDTVLGYYSGGMENFPRFLETWGLANTFTYNGSMVKMFPSLYATNVWGQTNVYDPPKRDWTYDLNFEDPLKLPPLTPSLQKLIRGQWATLAPNQTAAPSSP